jgi:hypothetical protein
MNAASSSPRSRATAEAFSARFGRVATDIRRWRGSWRRRSPNRQHRPDRTWLTTGPGCLGSASSPSGVQKEGRTLGRAWPKTWARARAIPVRPRILLRCRQRARRPSRLCQRTRPKAAGAVRRLSAPPPPSASAGAAFEPRSFRGPIASPRADRHSARTPAWPVSSPARQLADRKEGTGGRHTNPVEYRPIPRRESISLEQRLVGSARGNDAASIHGLDAPQERPVA